MSGDAQPSSNQRATEARPPPSPPLVKEKAAIGALCVVCGDRACSHLYYGVAACHGCKCFFWRTVKSRLNYVCRYGGTCSISTAGRNACRYCRFNRCLSVGMKMEAVKMDRKLTKRKREKNDGDDTDDGGNESFENTIEAKRAKSDNRLLITSLLLIDKTSSDGNAKLSSLHFVQPSLQNLLDEPELLDGYRSEMSYRATRQADEQLCYDTERRLVTWAIDWCRQTAEIGDVHHTSDKIALLRACCSSLALLELGWHSSSSQSDTRIPLCNNSFLPTHAMPPSSSFLNWKTIQSLSKWTQRELKPLCLQAKEVVLLKALILLNPDAHGLSPEAESSIRVLRERVHTALFQQLAESSDAFTAASRLAKILLLIPQLALMGVDVIEQVRVRNTFNKRSAFGEGLLFWQLYGDIFDDVHSDDSYLEHSASCSPTDSQYMTDSS